MQSARRHVHDRHVTTIGKKIADDVQNVERQPEDYINYDRLIPNLQLGNTTPEHILKIIHAQLYTS